MRLAIKPRSILVILGLVLLALLILFWGKYLAFGDYHPLASLTAQLVTILLIVLLRVAWVVYQRVKAGRATDKLMAGVARSTAADAARPSDEAVQLRERFDDAVATLKQSRGKGGGLYDMPWYVFIGAPGSGKTTALVNSGLKFPLEQRIGKGALRGVGGTRNCDWWFTDEAVFLDTAGRYTTQDSDASADAAAWKEFLGLLRQYRKRRPLNGVILTISAQDLMTTGPDGRAAHIAAARRRLDELNQELRVRLPVYVLVTKCDLVDGFTEYFGDLTAEGRAQVWGVTFSREETTGGEAAKAVGPELDALMVRLNERLYGRLEEETDARRRTKVFGFPQQMAALGPLVSELVGEVFGSTRFDKRILLRGVYFTSGTQEGTPIDRLLASIGRRFGMASEAVAPAAAGRGKAYFIESLLKDVLIGESGLAGLNWRQELRLGGLQLGAYIAMAAVAVLGVVLLSYSFRANRGYLADVSKSVEEFARTSRAASGAPLALTRLDALREVSETANRYRDGAPWWMRWGLFQGGSIGDHALGAYGSQLQYALLPFVAERFERRLKEPTADPFSLYVYLKAYLMLGDSEHFKPAYVSRLAGAEADSEAAASSLRVHLEALFGADATAPGRAPDDTLVAQARTMLLRMSSIPELAYRNFKYEHLEDQAYALQLDIAAGVAADKVRRRSGVGLSVPVPGMFTAQGFKKLTGGTATLELVQEFMGDAWIWGQAGPPASDAGRVAGDIRRIYEADYVRTWEAILDDIEPVPSAEVAEALSILGGPTSPLRAILQTVYEQTYIVKPPDATAAAAAVPGKQQMAGLDRFLGQAKVAAGMPAKEPGTDITQHFGQIHYWMKGDRGSAPIDEILRQLLGIRDVLNRMTSSGGPGGRADAAAIQELRLLITTLNQDAARLPTPVQRWFKLVGGRTQEAMISGAAIDLKARYEDVEAECSRLLTGRYPFADGSVDDLPLSDFERLFKPDGVFDSFFKANLESKVNTSRSPWTPQPGAAGITAQMLNEFELAHLIRRLFFPGGSGPRLEFTVTVSDLTPGSTTKLTLEINGRRIDYSRGGPQSFKVVWPGEGPGRVATSFETGRTIPGSPYRGPWALFHLLDASIPEVESRVRTAFTVAAAGGAARATIVLEADSADNPFTNSRWREFRCGR